jgi:hypothetical protein
MPGYSVWVNLLDYSTAVLPVTTVDKSVDVVDDGYKPISETDKKVWESCEFQFSATASFCACGAARFECIANAGNR